MVKKIYADVKLSNNTDIENAASGLIKPEEVRSVVVKGRIDTGCTHLAIPEDIANRLGLRRIEKISIRYANGQIEERWQGSVVYVEINNRHTVTLPIIEPSYSEVLIGNPILEGMDLYVNTKTGELYPNPESPDRPLAEAV